MVDLQFAFMVSLNIDTCWSSLAGDKIGSNSFGSDGNDSVVAAMVGATSGTMDATS
jgi:hypothetical protein